jgi:hypothetical protein
VLILGQPFASFRAIAKTPITLLTPWYSPLDSDLGIDPFEVFGQLISKGNDTKVRHVPYKTDCGLTSTHQPFIRAAGGIILICYSSFQQLSIVSQIRAVTSETPLVVLQLRRSSAYEVQAVSSPVPVIYMQNTITKRPE